jgi:hypothetical protein
VTPALLLTDSELSKHGNQQAAGPSNLFLLSCEALLRVSLLVMLYRDLKQKGLDTGLRRYDGAVLRSGPILLRTLIVVPLCDWQHQMECVVSQRDRE